MRVRYGKPIKAKSLLGKANIPFSYTAANVTFYPLTTGTFDYYAGPSVLNIKYVNRQANHKYFLFLNTDIVYSWSYFGIWDTYNTGYYGNRTPPIKDGNNYYALISPTTSVTNGVPSFQFGGTQNLPAIANYALIIDLTEIGLDNLTAQEFYNKYHQYFPLIATGEEITIDDKAGQISLFPRLLSIYQEVEYIESDGNQYLSLDVGSFNANFKLDIDFQQTSSATSELCLFGNSGLEVFTRSEGFGYWTSSNGSSFATNYASLRGQRVFASIDNSNGKMQVNSVVTTYTPKTVSSYTSINVFRYAYSDRYLFVGRIFYLKLYTGNKYIELIPCYRKSDNVTGMYDLVGKQFYTNQGTGTFLKGPNVNNTISCKVAGGSSDIYYGYNQLAINGDFANGKSSWADWNSATVVTNGIAEITRTNTSQSSLHQDISANPGDKIYVRATMWSDGTTSVRLGLNGGISWSGTATTSTTPVLFEVIKPVVSTGNGCRIELFGTGVAGTKYYAKEINAINLTTWFGAGKEPSTVEEFKEKFAKEYYGFCQTPIKLTRYQIEALPNYGYNQYCQYGDFSSSSGWRANNTSDTISINNGECTLMPGGAAYPGVIRTFNDYKLNHKMIYILDVYASSNNVGKSLCINNGTGLNTSIGSLKLGWNTYYKITTLNADKTSALTVFFTNQPALEEIKFRNIMAIDLTDWYGEGNEPTTIEEFKATFPNKYYPYSQKRLLNKYMINKLIN